MANSFVHQEKTYKIGDTVNMDYKIKEGEKERIQSFEGIVLRVQGATPATRMITVRKIGHMGIGVERVFPLSSPFIAKMLLVKKSNYMKAKLNFLQNLSDQQLRTKLYSVKKSHKPTKTKK